MIKKSFVTSCYQKVSACEPCRGTTAHIDTDALRHNVKTLAKLAGNSLCIPLKANAYGHDLQLCAQALKDEPSVEAFGVAVLSEAILLRSCGIDKDIWLFEGLCLEQDYAIALDLQLTIVIHDLSQIGMLRNALRQLSSRQTLSALKIWLKVDTGMHRLGIAMHEVTMSIEALQALTSVQLVGLMSHYACADEPQHPANREQIDAMQQLQRVAEEHNLRTSFANSAALLQGKKHGFQIGDIPRPGLASYGLAPFSDTHGAMYGLQPVMQLSARILSIKSLQQDDAVGYGHTWRAPQAGKLAIIGIGYGDGMQRELPVGWQVSSHQSQGLWVGRVSMDLSSLFFPLDAPIQIGDEVLLFGSPDHTAEAFARHRGSIPYTVTTQLTSRIPRIVCNKS